VDNVTVFGDYRWPNNDGIDPDSSINVTIRNSVIDTGDDAICPKSSAGWGPLRNLLIQNCQARSRSSAFKIGSATREDMSDILVQDFFVWDSNRGLAIQHRDQGNIDNVVFERVLIDGTSYQPFAWWGDGEAIWLTSVPRTVDSPQPGTISNIRYVNVTARAENGVVLSARNASAVSNVALVNVALHLTAWRPRRPQLVYEQPELDYRPGQQPERVVESKVDAVYVDNVVGMSLTNVVVQLDGKGPTLQTAWGECVGGPSAPPVSPANVTCVANPQFAL